MLLLSKFLPRFFQKKKSKRHAEDTAADEMPCLGDKGKQCPCKVMLLDETDVSVNVKTGSKGQVLLDRIFFQLNLLEKDYFGLRYLDAASQTHWLDPSKSIGAQIKTNPPHTFYFGVKFYAADPCKLHEEITRYQFFLQLKRDILQGRLPVPFETAVELAAYAVQSELGDFDSKRHSIGYVSEFRFVPNQTEEYEGQVVAIHRHLVGQVPAAAEYRYLDKAKWLEMYGVDLHPVQGEGNLEYFLGLTPTGVVVYRNKQKVGNYFWPRITKITFKAKMFMLRVKDKNNDENTYAFECTSKNACKHLWKCCIEHHAFFRLKSANESYGAGSLFKLGSKYRYSGRTEKQILAELSNRPPQKVVRIPSKRHQRRPSCESAPGGLASVAPSTSENMIVVTAGEHASSRGNRREMGYQSAPDSPRSTKSAPWETGNHRSRGMFTSGRESPTSVVSERMMFPRRPPSESESEHGNRRRYHRSRMESDTESEMSHHRNRRSRCPAETTDCSESESGARHRVRKYRRSAENLTYAENKWIAASRGRDGQAGPYDLRPNGSLTSMQSAPADTAHNRRKHRRRSRSPGNKKPPEELAQHFKYIDPAEEGLTENQLKELDLGYTKVETNTQPVKVNKTKSRTKSKSPKRRSYGELSEKSLPAKLPDGEPPPPYTDMTPKAKNTNSMPSLHPQKQQNRLMETEESLRSPMSVQHNETHTAPIVKTKPLVTSQRQQQPNGAYYQGPHQGPPQGPPQGHQQNYVVPPYMSGHPGQQSMAAQQGQMQGQHMAGHQGQQSMQGHPMAGHQGQQGQHMAGHQGQQGQHMAGHQGQYSQQSQQIIQQNPYTIGQTQLPKGSPVYHHRDDSGLGVENENSSPSIGNASPPTASINHRLAPPNEPVNHRVAPPTSSQDKAFYSPQTSFSSNHSSRPSRSHRNHNPGSASVRSNPPHHQDNRHSANQYTEQVSSKQPHPSSHRSRSSREAPYTQMRNTAANLRPPNGAINPMFYGAPPGGVYTLPPDAKYITLGNTVYSQSEKMTEL